MRYNMDSPPGGYPTVRVRRWAVLQALLSVVSFQVWKLYYACVALSIGDRHIFWQIGKQVVGALPSASRTPNRPAPSKKKAPPLGGGRVSVLRCYSAAIFRSLVIFWPRFNPGLRRLARYDSTAEGVKNQSRPIFTPASRPSISSCRMLAGAIL